MCMNTVTDAVKMSIPYHIHRNSSESVIHVKIEENDIALSLKPILVAC